MGYASTIIAKNTTRANPLHDLSLGGERIRRDGISS